MDKLDLIHEAIKDTREDIKEVSDRVRIIESETQKNTINLEEHMRRTVASEERIKIMETKFTLSWLLKNVAITVGSITTIIAAAAKLLGYL